MTVGRIRVLIAGNIYVKRALVRRFLEDDGYEVVAETYDQREVMPAIRRGEPDAIVIDDELMDAGTMQQLRDAAPDAKVVVFTSTSTAAAPVTVGADAYLEKGVGLAALTTLLGRLLGEDPASMALVDVGVAGAAGIAASIATTDGGATTPTEPIGATRGTTGGRAVTGAGWGTRRLVGITGGAILIVWGLIAMVTTGGGGIGPPPADTTDQTGDTVIAAPDGAPELDTAYASLDRLIAAIEAGNYVLATIEAQALMGDREAALIAGFTAGGLDAEITARLLAVIGGIPTGATVNLQQILGDLYPTLEDEDVPGGGSDVVLGPPAGGGSASSLSGTASRASCGPGRLPPRKPRLSTNQSTLITDELSTARRASRAPLENCSNG